MKKAIGIWLFLMVSLNANASGIGGIDIHGFISQGYLKSNNNNYYMAHTRDGTFEFNEIGINFVTTVSPGLRMGTQFFARDLGSQGNEEIILDWAFADYHWRDWLGLRVGKQKVNAGFYSTTRDMDMIRANILLPAGVYNESWRDGFQSFKGVGLYGLIPMRALGSVSYTLQEGLFELSPEGGIANAFRSPGFVDSKSTESDTATPFYIAWELPIEGLKFGYSYISTTILFSGSAMETATFLGIPKGDSLNLTLDYKYMVYSMEYSMEDLKFTSELLEISGDVSSEITDAQGKPIMKLPVNILGYYFGLSYRFTEWFELATYYSVFYSDKSDKDGKKFAAKAPQPNMMDLLNNPPSWFKNEYLFQPGYDYFQKDISLSFRFDINESWLVKIEGHAMNGCFGADALDNLPTEEHPRGTVQRWFLFAAKMSYIF